MTAWYEFGKIPHPAEEGESLLYPRIVSTKTVTTRELAKDIADGTTLNAGEVQAALFMLVQRIRRHLADGERVQLDDLGYFSLALECTRPVSDPSEVRAESIRLKDINFRPCKSMLEETQSLLKPVRYPVKPREASKLSEEAIKARLDAYFQRTPAITRTNFMQITGIGRLRAYEELNRLLEEGYLRRVGGGRNVMYLKKE